MFNTLEEVLNEVSNVLCPAQFLLAPPLAAQIPYCATRRSRSGSGNCSENRRQFSSPTWFLNPCKIYKSKKQR